MVESAASSDNQSSSLLKTRLEVYGVYGSEQDLSQDMEKYNVDVLHSNGSHMMDTAMEDEDEFLSATQSSNGMNGTLANDANETNSAQNNVIMTRQQTDRDVWGRFPLKEAKEFVPCPNCGRPNSTLRLAMHLVSIR